MTNNALSSIALEQTEFRVYECLLKLGESPVRKVVAASSFKRPTVYNALYELEKKGLVKKVSRGKILAFRPESPVKLLSLAQNRMVESETAYSYLNSIMPMLSSAYMLSTEQPVIRFFQGVAEVKNAYLYMLEGEKDESMLGYVIIDNKLDEPFIDFWPQYFRKRKKNNLTVKAIAVNTNEALLYKMADSKSLRITRLIPLEKFPSTAEINILGNKVGFFSKRQDTYIATIIEDKEIARSQRALFDLAWEAAGEYDRKLTTKKGT